MPLFPRCSATAGPRMLLLLAATLGLGLASVAAADEAGSYRAEIRWTSYGIPHITASGYGNLGFGQGYAFALNHAGYLSDQVIKVRSERARYFGPGPNDENIVSDFGYKALRVTEYAAASFGKLSQDAQDMFSGYAAGYNKAIAEMAAGRIPSPNEGPRCVLIPITGVDLMAKSMDLSLLLGSRLLVDYIGNTDPPAQAPTQKESAARIEALPNLRRVEAGSNAAAFGRDMTVKGRGMLLSNNHLPWEGELQWMENHLTIPGELNVTGIALFGTPGVQIGFNEHVAWSHTVTRAQHMTLYRLKLVEGDPTSYWYDGEARAMEQSEATIQVLQKDGTLSPLSRTLYRSHYGPVLEFGPLEWNTGYAFTVRDANENNYGAFETILAIDKARGIAEFNELFSTHASNPWTYIEATDRKGEVFFADISSVPNLSDAAIEAFFKSLKTDFLQSVLWKQQGMVLLDGSDPLFEWVDEGTPQPGVIPFSKAPKFTRTDYCANMNDSHWMNNLNAPLEGYSPLYGPERTARNLRTRMGLAIYSETGKASARGADGRFTMKELQDAVFNNRVWAANAIRTDLVARSKGVKSITVKVDGEERSVDLRDARRVLKEWDGLAELDSRGLHIIREFMEITEWETTPRRHRVAFDFEDPVATPDGLAEPGSKGRDWALEGLAKVVLRLERAGIALDARLGDIQFTRHGNRVIALHGGQQAEGAYNIVRYFPKPYKGTDLLSHLELAPLLSDKQGIWTTYLSTEGYLCNAGNSFVMVVEFADDGPHAEAMLLYSQSDLKSSPHFDDQFDLYVNKQWRPMPFTEDEILGDPNYRSEVVTTD